MKKYFAYIIIGILLVVMLFQQGCNRSKVSELESRIGILVVDSQTLAAKVNKLGDTVKIQRAIAISDHDQLNKYADSVFALKKKMGNTIAYYKNKISVQNPRVEIVYTNDTVEVPKYITKEFIDTGMITVPRKFTVDSPLYLVEGVVKKTGVEINKNVVHFNLSGRFVEGKYNILKPFAPKPIEYQVTSDNPNVIIDASSSLIFKPAKRTFLQKITAPLILVGAGIVAGIAMSQ